MCNQAFFLMQAKNADYADDGDALGNLRLCEQMELCPIPIGILIRTTDKLRRLSSLLRRPAAVKDESIRDTCLDIINYTVLLLASLPAPPESSHDPTRSPTAGEPV